MNKKEAIKTIEQDKIQVGRFTEITREVNAIHRKIEMVDYVPLETVVSVIDKISESQKVTVPKFVAERLEWYKRHQNFWSLDMVLSRLDDGEELGDWAYDDDGELIPERVDMVARAWLAYPNIAVEQEKLYTVEIPNPNSKGNHKIYLCKDDTTGKVYLCKGNFNPKKNKNLKLTEVEIRKDFEWAWQWAKEAL